MKEHTIVFVGNPNVGKSAWINELSDAHFKVGNWPGVTVERKEASVIWQKEQYHLIDLPGCYSLNAQGNEEEITSRFLKEHCVDLIVNVVDASNLSRNLYLTLLLRELQIPMIIIFNFMDVVEKAQMQIDTLRMARRLQIPILPVSVFHKQDKKIVKEAILAHIQDTGFYYPLLSNEDVEVYVDLYNYIDDHLPSYVELSEQKRHMFTFSLLKQETSAFAQAQSWQMDIGKLEELSHSLNIQKVNKSRYHVIEDLMKYVKYTQGKSNALTKKLDHILLHRYLGLPIFFLLFTMLLLFVFQFSAPFNAFIEFLINDIFKRYFHVMISILPQAVQDLLMDGVLAGVGGVLSFVPMLALLYLVMSLLEESGYMSRIAFLLDRMMRCFHLSGKSFVSLLLGFGCNVPAIYAARTLDNEHQKRLTAILVPFMSCGARLPVYVLFASAFFPSKAAWMMLTVYGIGILMALLLALLLSRRKEFKDDGLFVMELPAYHMPNLSVVAHKVKEEVKNYVKKAFGVVLWAMVLLWGISYFPDGDIQTSYMASASKFIAPIFEPAGFGTRWECVASLPGGIIAKETIVGYFHTVMNVQEEEVILKPDITKDLERIKDTFVSTCQQAIHDTLFPSIRLKAEDGQDVKQISTLWQDSHANVRAFSFMVYVLLSIPCIMTLQALYHEYGIKLLALSFGIMLVLPYLVSVFIYQFFSFFL